MPVAVLGSERRKGVIVGCVACIADESEIEVRVTRRIKALHYRITLRDHEPWAAARVGDLITLLDTNDVEVAILPEMALTSALLERWTDVLRTRVIPSTASCGGSWPAQAMSRLRTHSTTRRCC
jgi:hypothetical protein